MNPEQQAQGGAFSTMTISDADFERLTNFIQTKYGINLRHKRQLIISRLAFTIKNRGFQDFSEYVNFLLTKGQSDDINLLLSKLTTNYTYFMREPEAFDYFKSSILPDIVHRHQKDASLSIWSAGCSTGEEPYNISMYLMDYLGAKAKTWDTRVLATDLSTDALAKATAGVYELPDTLPASWKQDYFVPETEGRFAVAPRIKNNVIFQQFNLMDPIQFKRKFDVIFCRNVMIYFDQPTKNALVRRLYDATAPGGYLIISLSESLSPDTPYKRVSTSIFQKK